MTSPAVGRIRERSTFRALASPAGRATCGPIKVSFAPAPSPDDQPFPQVAYAIGRRHGVAVRRNLLRRRLRSAVREVAGDVPPGNYLVRPGPATATLDFAELRSAVRRALVVAGRADVARIPGATDGRR